MDRDTKMYLVIIVLSVSIFVGVSILFPNNAILKIFAIFALCLLGTMAITSLWRKR